MRSYLIAAIVLGLVGLFARPVLAAGGTETFLTCMRAAGDEQFRKMDCYEVEIVTLQMTVSALMKELHNDLDEEDFNEVISAEGLFQEYQLTHCIQEARWAPNMDAHDYTMALRHAECQRRVYTSRVADLVYLQMAVGNDAAQSAAR